MSNTVGNFYYFAYGTYVDPAVMKAALAAVSGAAVPIIVSSHAALLPGYRLVSDAVSAEGPRLGRLNLAPFSLIPRDPSAFSLSSSASPASRGSPGKSKSSSRSTSVSTSGANNNNNSSSSADDACRTAFRDGVRGMLYELPANMRDPLMQAVAREGSFNMYAMLTCYELRDLRHGVRDADAPIHEALVIAAVDLPLMERKFFVEKTMLLRWMVLPPPQHVAVPAGLSTTATPASAAAKAEKAASSAAGGDGGDEAAAALSAAYRWPGLHWCNCINSTRVAPSGAYAAAIEKAYCEHLLLHIDAAGDDAAARDTGNSHPALATKDSEVAATARVSYGDAVARMVLRRVRDVAKDAAEQRTWYLAYGSNLSWEQVCLRIGPPYQRRAVKLRDYVLVPNKNIPNRPEYATFGYYNVEPVALRQSKEAQGVVRHRSTMPDYVCGAAYEISTAQLEMMDGYERGYDRQLLRCTDLRDPTVAPWECWTYIAQETSEDVLPSQEYLSRVLEGADILPLEYMEGIRATPTNPLRSPRQDKRLRKEL